MFRCCSPSSDGANLHDIDSTAIWLKHDRNIRKRSDYQTLRKLAREGCKKSDRRMLWVKATNATEEDIVGYKQLTKTLFEGIEMHDFPQFPMFGSRCRFKTLSIENKYIARKILVVLAVEHDSLHYCPQIPFVVETIVQHVEEGTAFAILNAMVTVSKQNDWYFRTDFFNFRVRLRTFIDVFADNVKLVAQHINETHIPVEKILANAFATMYTNYLNEQTYLRVIDTFSIEGYKVLFRVGLALLNNASEALLKTSNLAEFRQALITESRKLDPDQLSQLAFGVYLSRDKFDRLDLIHKENLVNVSKTEELEVARRWPSFDPKWIKQSTILKSKADFLQLWVWLPPKCHIGDFQLLFNTAEDGYKLATLYDKCAGRQNLLILVETTTDESFGFHVSSLYEAPQEERFVDTQIITFMLSYPNREIPRQVFEPPLIQFAYLRNQPERTFSMQNIPQKPNISEGTMFESLISQDTIDPQPDNIAEQELENVLNNLDHMESDVSAIDNAMLSGGKEQVTQSYKGSTHLRPDRKNNKLATHLNTSLEMNRSVSAPQENHTVISHAKTMDDTKGLLKERTNKPEPTSSAPLWRRASSPLEKTKVKDEDEFTDEEFGLFDVKETKSNWKLNIFSTAHSLVQPSPTQESVADNVVTKASTFHADDIGSMEEKEEKNNRDSTYKDERTTNGSDRDLLKNESSPKSRNRHTYIEINTEYMAIGDGNINAIYVDKDLHHGMTIKCPTLRSPRLVKNPAGDFQIRNVEVWCVE